MISRRAAILYRTMIPSGLAGPLTIKNVHDIAQVYLGDRRVAVLDRRYGGDTVMLPERPRNRSSVSWWKPWAV